MPEGRFPNPRKQDIMAGERRLSRPDSALPDWHLPDAAYRPIPIAWFAAAFLAQMVVLYALFMLLIGQSGWLTIGLGSLVTGLICQWTWQRGMQRAPRGWQVATVLFLIVQLSFVCLGAAARI
jgi:hypothetical protein